MYHSGPDRYDIALRRATAALALNEVAQAADGGLDFPHRIQASLPNAVGRPAEARWKEARSLT